MIESTAAFSAEEDLVKKTSKLRGLDRDGVECSKGSLVKAHDKCLIGFLKQPKTENGKVLLHFEL